MLLSQYSSKQTKVWFSRIRFVHTIRISNSLVGNTAQSQLEISQEKPLTWYACGPTVYDSAHIGHARTYVVTDILRRIISDFFHFPLNFAMGITDIDDKIIKKGKEHGFTVDEEFRKLAADLEKEFLSDMDSLNVRRPDAILRVTEHIEEIIAFVTSLINKKHAYVAADGVYFDLSSMKDNQTYDKFGCASGAENEENDADPTEVTIKKNPRDFALWKITSKVDPGWESPWGHGRPGWHIECSAVTHSYFGQHLDIHSGGIDLKFPHHTNEIAQSECHHGHDWVKVWLHTGHLHIRGRKMSKSLKNFVSIQEYFLQQLTSSPSDDFRIFCLQHKYSALLTYAPERILEAASFRNKIISFYQQVESLQQRMDSQPQHTLSRKPTKESILLQHQLFILQQDIPRSLANDFDCPTVMQRIGAIVGDSIQYLTLVDAMQSQHTQVNQHPIEPLINIVKYTSTILSMLGLQFPGNKSVDHSMISSTTTTQQQLDVAIDAAVQLRTNARNIAIQGMKVLKTVEKTSTPLIDVQQQLKDHYQALLHHTDQTRDALSEKLHIQIEDSKNSGSTWRRKT